jgi:O-antigen ligase
MLNLIEKLVMILAFLIPLEGIIIFSGVTFSRLVVILIILIYFINLVIAEGSIQISKTIIFYFVFILFIIFSAIYHESANYISSRAISIYSNFLLVLSIYNSSFNEYKIIQFMKSFIIGLFIANTIAIIETLTGHIDNFYIVGLGSNLYAVYCLLAFFINIYFVINYKLVRKKYHLNYHILFALLNLHGLISSDSRLNLIYLVAFFVLLVLNMRFIVTNAQKFIVSIIFILFTVYIFNNLIINYVLSTEEITIDSRLIIWIANFNIFLDYPFTGIGFGEFGNYFGDTYQFLFETVKDYGNDRSTHSTFLGSMAEFGILGLLFWVLFIYLNIKDYKKSIINKNNIPYGLSTRYIIQFLVLICVAGVITSDMITYKLFWIIFTLNDRIINI